MRELFQTIHINTDTHKPEGLGGPGAQIDKRIDELFEAVKELRSLHSQSSFSGTQFADETETKDDILNAETDDFDDFLNRSDSPPAPPPFHRAPSNVEKIDEREVVEKAVTDAIHQTQQTLQEALKIGQEKLDEVIENGPEVLLDSLQHALDHLKEKVREVRPRSESDR
jgi:hypothetical protein